MRLTLIVVCALALLELVAGYQVSNQLRRIAAVRRVVVSVSMSTTTETDAELKRGDFDGITKFTRVSGSKKLGKYEISATIKKAEMNSFLVEYKAEMKRRKVVFPGFRAGNLPPYVMSDVRRYLVCFGLETMLGQLCNLNELQMCSPEGNEVPFGEDAYYEQIIQPDFRGYDFLKQRDTWREGTDFPFSAVFHAISEEEDENEGSSSTGSESGPVIDAEEVKE